MLLAQGSPRTCSCCQPSTGPLILSLPRQPAQKHFPVPQKSVDFNADSLGILWPLLVAAQWLSADVPEEPLSPVQGEKPHAGLFRCLSPSLTEAVTFQLSQINRHYLLMT